MVRRIIVSTFLAISAATSSMAQEQMSLVGANANYSCDEASRIKFSEEEYTALERVNQTIVDATYQQCQIDQEAAENNTDPEERVVVVRARSDGEERVFYGFIRTEDLNNAQVNCAGAGAAAGAAIAVYGAATAGPSAQQAGELIYQFSGVSCGAIASALRENNLLAVLAPTNLVGDAVAGKVITDIVNNIPFVSDADAEAVSEGVEDLTPSAEIEDGKVVVETPLGDAVIDLDPF